MSRLFSTLLLIVAAVLAGWLAFSTLTGSGVAGCTASGGCGTVLSSRWAYLGGVVPVSLLGLALYLSTLFAWIVGWRKLARVCEWTILLGAAWFLLAQGFILHAFCPWCCATHAAAVLAVSIRWAFVGRRSDSTHPRVFGITAPITAVIAVAALALAQWQGPAPETSQVISTPSPASPDTSVAAPLFTLDPSGTVTLLGDASLSFYVRSLPVPSEPDGASSMSLPGVPLILLHDWTCQHCRSLHQTLLTSSSASPGTFMVLALPGHRDPTGEKVHRLMLTAWLGNPSAYTAAAATLLAGSLPATPEAVEADLVKRVGPAWPGLAQAHAPVVDHLMKLGAAFLRHSDERQISTLPQLHSATATLVGEPQPAELQAFLQQALTPPAAVPVPIAAAAPPAPVTPAPASPTPPASPATASPTPAASPAPGARPPPVAITANASKIEFEKTTLNLPPCRIGEDSRATFRFTNTGPETLEIASVQPSCGCTAVSGWPRSVPPGGKGEFSLVFHSKGYPQGVFTKGIMVRSNASNADPATHMTQLQMVATVGAPNAAPAVTPPPVSASGVPGQGLRLSHSEILLPPSGLQKQASVFEAYLTLSGLPAGVEPTATWSLPAAAAAAAAAWPQPTLTKRQPGSYRIGLTFPAGWVAPPSAKQTPPPALVLKAGKHEARMTVRTPPAS
ncbi:MAG: DUF1573 domain-containing protein [Verrucomicrobia bacterium]|nr:DUF1573 domain-containing protein [Verrucomicrobiota bacterium]